MKLAHGEKGMSIRDKCLTNTDRKMNIIQPARAHTGLREGLIILNNKKNSNMHCYSEMVSILPAGVLFEYANVQIS